MFDSIASLIQDFIKTNSIQDNAGNNLDGSNSTVSLIDTVTSTVDVLENEVRNVTNLNPPAIVNDVISDVDAITSSTRVSHTVRDAINTTAPVERISGTDFEGNTVQQLLSTVRNSALSTENTNSLNNLINSVFGDEERNFFGQLALLQDIELEPLSLSEQQTLLALADTENNNTFSSQLADTTKLSALLAAAAA